MQKIWFGVLTILAFGLGGCNTGLLGEGSTKPLDSIAPVFNDHPLFKQGVGRDNVPLLARYYWVDEANHNGSIQDQARYWELKYQPRQSKYQGYEGWDVLTIPPGWWKPDKSRNDWLRLYLNRPAKVVVVWETNDLWLSGWQKGSLKISNETYNTYSRDFEAGEIGLGTPGAKGSQSGNYFVLISEKGGTPSKEPTLPAGVTTKPLPNQSCPSWLENVWTYKTVYGEFKEGEDYKTWRPQIDPIYWCYYRNDYGSDPRWVGYKPAFGYVARKFNDQAELDVGFKGFAIRDEGMNQGWYINIHSETGVQTRACARFHTVVIAVTNLKTGEVLAELGYKGDFGASVSNQGGNAPVNITCTDPRDGKQKTQAQIIQETGDTNSKNIRIFNGGQDPFGYENWHGGGNKNLGMSYWGDDKNGGKGEVLNVDIRNPASGCSDNNCTTTSPTGESAMERTLFISNLKIRYTSEIEALDKKDGTQDGYFWTDLYGDPLAAGVTPGAQGTIRQYIKPNFNSGNGNGDGLAGGFSSEDAWRQVYLEGMGVPNLELEGAIGDQN